MKPGQIVVDRVSQRFLVSERPYRTLKDLVVARGRGSSTDVWALRDVSLAVEPGEALGLVGRNGSGKTTLLRLASGIFKPTSGRIAVSGRIGSLLELGAGFHPDFTGRENVYLNGSIYGLSRARIREVMDEIVAFAELERSIDLPVRTYSSGMYMRLGFSVAAHIQADVLLLDEVFAVGDEDFQRKCFGKIRGVQEPRRDDRLRLARRPGRREALRPRRPAPPGRRRLRRRRRARRSRSTAACSPASAARTSWRPACASGAAARRRSSLRACSTRTGWSGSSSPRASRRSSSS